MSLDTQPRDVGVPLSIDSERLRYRLRTLGDIGRDDAGLLTRLAASDADKAGRDLLAGWIAGAGLELMVDRIGNMFAVWGDLQGGEAPVMLGSHIDTVIQAGLYDGAYGVLGGLEAIQTLKAAGVVPASPVVLAAFTNEEGVRYAPSTLGSLAYVGGLSVEAAHATVGIDGTRLGDELARIGWVGPQEPGFLRPKAYVELHIEQGPVLEREGYTIGAVENLQGISWQRVIIDGTAGHAGTTPMSMRHDAGQAAARVLVFLRERAVASNTPTVATVGRLAFEPNAINVIPSRATFTVDLRDPDEARLQAEEAALAAFLDRLAREEGVAVSIERLSRFAPVTFDGEIVAMIEAAAAQRNLRARRITSGAGHDAQMMARLCASAMIFVPSIDGISHSPHEDTPADDLSAGANVLLDVVAALAGAELRRH